MRNLSLRCVLMNEVVGIEQVIISEIAFAVVIFVKGNNDASILLLHGSSDILISILSFILFMPIFCSFLLLLHKRKQNPKLFRRLKSRHIRCLHETRYRSLFQHHFHG